MVFDREPAAGTVSRDDAVRFKSGPSAPDATLGCG